LAPPSGPGRREVGEAERRLQATRLGVVMAQLEALLHHQEAPEMELRALNSKVIHLATILKVGIHLHLP